MRISDWSSDVCSSDLDFARVADPILQRLDLAQQFGGVAAHALGGDFEELDLARGIEDEGAAVGEADAFTAAASAVSARSSCAATACSRAAKSGRAHV